MMAAVSRPIVITAAGRRSRGARGCIRRFRAPARPSSGVDCSAAGSARPGQSMTTRCRARAEEGGELGLALDHIPQSTLVSGGGKEFARLPLGEDRERRRSARLASRTAAEAATAATAEPTGGDGDADGGGDGEVDGGGDGLRGLQAAAATGRLGAPHQGEELGGGVGGGELEAWAVTACIASLTSELRLRANDRIDVAKRGLDRRQSAARARAPGGPHARPHRRVLRRHCPTAGAAAPTAKTPGYVCVAVAALLVAAADAHRQGRHLARSGGAPRAAGG